MLFDRFRKLGTRQPRAEVGERIFAIGDVHGRYDLLTRMLDRLERFNNDLPPADHLHVILLGDLVDRGPDSARVLQLAKAVQEQSDRLVVLKGNHELLMLKAMEGFPGMLRAWMRSGGDHTLRSFGIDPGEIGENPLEAANIISEAVPPDLIAWLKSLPLTARSRDYLFCHAGIRPGVPIGAQKADDLLWIREEFLKDERDHGVVVVHGHNVETEYQVRHNRIGIDTGAYRSGTLTALYVEGAERDIISVSLPANDAAPRTVSRSDRGAADRGGAMAAVGRRA